MRRAATAAILSLILSATAAAVQPSQPEPIPSELFVPILPTFTSEPTSAARTGPSAVLIDPRAILPSSNPPERPATGQPAPRTRVQPKVVLTGDSIVGKASWYCKAGVSVCHYRYPDDGGADLYAAACGKLRRAMGSGWRNDVVRVRALESGRSVTVKLVDWCGSEDKTIDLYWDAMKALGGTGVLRVEVSW